MPGCTFIGWPRLVLELTTAYIREEAICPGESLVSDCPIYAYVDFDLYGHKIISFL